MAGLEGGSKGIDPRELGVLPAAELTTERRITPEMLLLDNKSQDSRRLRIEWNALRADGQLALEWDCDDARNHMSLRIAQIRSISTGGDEESYESYEGLYNDNGVRIIAVVFHYDKETEKKGKAPEGCGGQGVKGKQQANEAPTLGGAYGYVDKKIAHRDPLIQVLKSADQISKYTSKPILAAARDHLSGRISPVAFFQQREGEPQLIYSAVRVGNVLDGSYKPEEIYANGVPVLDKSDPILKDFFMYFAENDYEVRKLAEKYPDLRDRMKVQNPDALVISTQVRPLRSKYYTTFEDPNKAFEITIARCRKTLEASTRITNKAIQEVLEQAHYAMTHALDNRGKEGKEFRDTRTVLIETTHIDESRKIAQALAETEFGARWLSEENDVIIAEVRGGEIVDNKIGYFKPTA
ncbi:MAG: hypothetical protein M1444_02605 [Patescibacteria group bacterium]|nr:hypothetical protein [Patescibacteria group bacterium]